MGAEPPFSQGERQVKVYGPENLNLQVFGPHRAQT